jgi:hypothetical protein
MPTHTTEVDQDEYVVVTIVSRAGDARDTVRVYSAENGRPFTARADASAFGRKLRAQAHREDPATPMSVRTCQVRHLTGMGE